MIFPLVALHDLLGNIGSYQAMINKRPLPGTAAFVGMTGFGSFAAKGRAAALA